jgi:hypothetical protein
VLAASNTVCAQPAEPVGDALRIVAPNDGSTTESFLTAILRWQYTLRADLQPIINIRLRVSERADFGEPIVDVALRDHQTSYRLAVVPGTTYYWEIVPFDVTPQGRQFDMPRAARAKYTAGLPRNDFAAPDEIRYRKPREGAHWQMQRPLAAEQLETLSPWYALKSYHTSPPPQLADIRDRLPAPVWGDHPQALDAYSRRRTVSTGGAPSGRRRSAWCRRVCERSTAGMSCCRWRTSTTPRAWPLTRLTRPSARISCPTGRSAAERATSSGGAGSVRSPI